MRPNEQKNKTLCNRNCHKKQSSPNTLTSNYTDTLHITNKIELLTFAQKDAALTKSLAENAASACITNNPLTANEYNSNIRKSARDLHINQFQEQEKSCKTRIEIYDESQLHSQEIQLVGSKKNLLGLGRPFYKVFVY